MSQNCVAGEQDLPSPDYSSTAQPMAEAGQAAVYQGGFYMDLHRMLGVQSGSEVPHAPPPFPSPLPTHPPRWPCTFAPLSHSMHAPLATLCSEPQKCN